MFGLTFVGLAAGAPKVRGLVAAGFAAGGQDVRGVLLAGAFTTVPTGGEIRGLAASPVNWRKKGGLRKKEKKRGTGQAIFFILL